METEMNKNDLRRLAKQHHIFDASLSKTELIRKIQLAEGNFDCFAKADQGHCDQTECLWWQDCQLESAAAQGLPH